MNENENLVVEEQTAENVETTTEETPKTYTEAEFNAKLDEVLGKKIARKEAKIRKEYDRKYGDLMETLRAGTGKETVEEVNDAFRGFYQQKGIEIPKKAEYSAKDIETLAKAEADEYIRGGFEDVAEEVDRLTDIGFDNMTAREKAVFKILAEHRQKTEKSNELAEIGVTEDVYNSEEFQDFASKFNSSTPIKDVWDIYNKSQPKKEYKTMGSMKNTATEEGIKDYYTPEEARRFSAKDFEKNPKLYERVVESSYKWK
jgi:hypothetical protein